MKNNLYRVFAKKLYGNFGTALFKEFDRLNKLYFDNSLNDKPLLVGITPFGKSLGVFFRENASIMVHMSYFREFDKVVTDDLSFVLLHEMMHANLHQAGQEDLDESHGKKWANECNRLAPMLGIKNVFYTVYKRGKTPKVKAGNRQNIYIASEKAPKDHRLASRNELLRFPYATLSQLIT